MLLLGYAPSPFREFECYLRVVIGLNGDDIQLILKQYSSTFITYELSPGIYSIKKNSEAIHPLGDHEGTLKNQYDDISMKTKLVLIRFGLTFGTLRFDAKSFLIHHWVLHRLGIKPTNAIHVDRPGVYSS